MGRPKNVFGKNGLRKRKKKNKAAATAAGRAQLRKTTKKVLTII